MSKHLEYWRGFPDGDSRTAMTSKERWLAALEMGPVDRLPFWPKLDDSYRKARAGSAFSSMDLDQVQEWIGSDKHVGIASGLREVRRKTALETSHGDDVCKTGYCTPHGRLELIERFDASSGSWHPVRFPVEQRGDIGVMRDFFADTTIELDEEELHEAQQQAREVGPDGISCVSIGTTALMRWVQRLAGPERGQYLLADYPSEVEALFETLHQALLRKTELVAENSPADAFYLVENTSTTLVSPEQFHSYCYGPIEACGNIVRDAGGRLILHMCGHLKGLLGDLARLPVCGFEAFTSPPVGDTTLLDGRAACPDKCLIGGTNAALWTRSAEEIIAKLEEDLGSLAHHRGIVVTSAGVMPPACAPETIRAVCEWVKGYPVKV